MLEPQEDCSAYYQAPVFYMLRNAASLAIAEVLVKNLKDADYVKKTSKDKLEGMTLAELLRMVHNKGKKEEEKRKKRALKNVDDQENESASRTLHINNLKENEEVLMQMQMEQFFNEANFPELIAKLCEFDVTFPLNIITNDILKFNISKELFSAVSDVKVVRNCTYHSKGKVERKDVEEKLMELKSALTIISDYLQWPHERLQGIISQGTDLLKLDPTSFVNDVLENLRQEFAGYYHDKFSDISGQSVSPTLKDTRGETKVIEDFEEFLEGDELPILLCGSPGSGKSTVLQKLTQKFYSGEQKLKYKVVMYLNSSSRIIEECDFRKIVSQKIEDCCPISVSKYSIDTIMEVIKSSATKLLFLVSCNIRSLDKIRSMSGGKWVVCSQHSDSEPTLKYHVIRVEPLSDVLIKQMLSWYVKDSKQYECVVKLYDDCSYKGLLSSPDMVAIFSEIQTKTPCNQLLQTYINRKLSKIENHEDQCIALGKIVFCYILKNRREYPASELCNIIMEVQNVFLIPRENNTFVFKYRILEDLLASKYVASNPRKACEEWLVQVPLFKAVFRFTCAKWCDNEELLERNIKYLKPYLSKYLGVKTSSKANLTNDIYRVDGESSAADSFTKWPYLISLAKCCKFQREVMDEICKLLARKSTWVFKCKFIEDEKVNALFRILENIRVTRAVVIRIESGYAAATLGKIWKMLNKLPGLCENVTIQITVRHKKSIPQSRESNLSAFTSCIVSDSLYITRYIGPFICNTPDILRCRCMQKLTILDVCVYDISTLVNVLSCEGLQHLKAFYIKVYLRESNQDDTRFPNIRLPDLPYSVDMKLTITYFDGLQHLLNRIENPEQLHSLIIHRMNIKEDFHLSFSAFENLESLFIRFCRISACPVENDLAMETEPICDDSMETDNIDDLPGDVYRMKHHSLKSKGKPREALDQPSSSKNFSHKNWPFELRLKLELPKSLQRLLLRNTGFCNDANIFHLIEPWKGNSIQRLTILDSFLSVKGVRKILEKHLNVSDEEEASRHVKKLCMDRTGASLILKEDLFKHQRLEKEKREERRRKKPEGKELIITSQINLCVVCQQFPCCCHSSSERDNDDSLQDVVNLIEFTYHYEILSLSYTSGVVTVRKDTCGDLRVHCCLTNLDDDRIANLDEGGNESLKSFFIYLKLAQCICLDHTKLTLRGAECVIRVLKEIKGDSEPFSLAIRSKEDLPSEDEVRNSVFVHFLKQEKCLAQFKFSCYCENECHYLKKSRENNIYFNDQQLDA